MATGTIQKNMVLLWTNPNPTSAFAAQTISVDISEYSFVAIEFKTHKNVEDFFICLFSTGKKAGAGATVMGGFYNPSTQASANAYTREVDLTAQSAIGFSGSFYASSGTSWQSTASAGNELIPSRIWGIKA